MIKEEAKEVLRCRTNLGYGIVIENESTQVIDEALDLAIKALEQEPILDKIRAEIEEASTYDGIYIDRAYVLEIIDKYNAESEGRTC